MKEYLHKLEELDKENDKIKLKLRKANAEIAKLKMNLEHSSAIITKFELERSAKSFNNKENKNDEVKEPMRKRTRLSI